jgi:hypothetical protein
LGATVNVLIVMGGARYDAITEQVIRDAPGFGADAVWVYDDVWVDAHPFRKLNAWLWDHPGDKNGKRGFGWYAWKPLIILDAIERAENRYGASGVQNEATRGDVVLYLDGDSRPVSSMLAIFNTARRDGAMLFASQGHNQEVWCKRGCYEAMGQDRIDAPAGCSRFAAFRVGGWKERQFLYEWLTYSVNRRATTFDASAGGEDGPLFEEHRTEQAIMSNLAHKYGYKLWRECDDSGEGWDVDRDVMPHAIFQQTRVGGGNVEGGSRFRNVVMP